MDLYDTTVPPLMRLTEAMPRILGRLDCNDAPLRTRLASDSFDAGEHLSVALGFVPRTVLPLIGKAVPERPLAQGRAELLAQTKIDQTLLSNLTREGFNGSENRMIDHVAGQTTLRQSATDYALLFALPNATFHLAMGYATLRLAGVPLTKGDFDGFHHYPPDFRFED
ncbi:MAG: DUF1993 family protein [Pseudomonadota bacterium]